MKHPSKSFGRLHCKGANRRFTDVHGHVLNHILILLTALLLAPLAALHAAETPRQRPNILLIISDDQGYGDFSIHGNTHLRTPNIDKLATTGVRFDRFYVNSFCAPTRAALLTGRWPLRTGCHGVTANREAMKASEVTLAEALKGAGYRSACIGKWHNGEQYPFTPQGQGFDEAFGFNNGHWNNYFNPTLLRGSKAARRRNGGPTSCPRRDTGGWFVPVATSIASITPATAANNWWTSRRIPVK